MKCLWALAFIFHLALSNQAHARDGEDPSFRKRMRLSRLACRTLEEKLGVGGSDAKSAALALSVVLLNALVPELDRILVGKATKVDELPFYRHLRDALLAEDGEAGTESDIARQREIAPEMLLFRPMLEPIRHALQPVNWWTDALR